MTKKKLFDDGNVIKECFDVADDSLFNGLRNKTEICDAIKEVQLSPSPLEEWNVCPVTLSN
jgi:hypothetical protein